MTDIETLKRAILKDELPLNDGAATSWTAQSQYYARDCKKRFAMLVIEEFPEIAPKVIRHCDHHAKGVYVIDVAALKRILVEHNAFPEGKGKNYGLLEWVIENKDFVSLMLL
jgi:hypothetical protein